MVILLEIRDNRIILPNKLGCRKPRLRAGRRGRLPRAVFRGRVSGVSRSGGNGRGNWSRNEEPVRFCWIGLIPPLLQSPCPEQQQCLPLDHRPEMCSQRNSAMCLGGLCGPRERGYPSLTFLSSPSWGGGRKPDNQDPQNLNRHLLLERSPKPQRNPGSAFINQPSYSFLNTNCSQDFWETYKDPALQKRRNRTEANTEKQAEGNLKKRETDTQRTLMNSLREA